MNDLEDMVLIGGMSPEDDPDLAQSGGFWWPAQVQGTRVRYLAHQIDVDVAIRQVPKSNRRTAIQAGGFNGLWPLRLAEKFAAVHTFECHPINYRCLCANVAGTPVITTHNAALADRAGSTTFVHNPKNMGGGKCRQPTPKDGTNVLTVETMTIDSLGLDDVDLIYLDVEGMEFAALKGAQQTIAAAHPVIGLESWLHGEKMRPEWRWSEPELVKWLASLGYREAARVSHDVIFTCSQ